MTAKKQAPKSSEERRDRGDGGLYWSEKRQRWIAEITIGYQASGKRIVRRGSGMTKTEAKDKLKKIMRDHEDGLTLAASAGNYTVAKAAEDWLEHGLPKRSASTHDNYSTLVHKHIIPDLGARKLRELTTKDVELWLGKKAKTHSTRTLRLLKSTLSRIITRAQATERVKRNVAELLEDVPEGTAGRPSKSLTFAQALAVLTASETSPLHAYIVVSLLTGARTEEMRELRWDHVDLIGAPTASPAVPPHIMVWHSVRAKGETKTRKSRRTLALPERAVGVLKRHGEAQNTWRGEKGFEWKEDDLVFCSDANTALDAANVRREFRRVVQRAGLDPSHWVPRELRHSFVSLLSDHGMSSDQISKLVGHSSTNVTETVYRHQIRPVIQTGAEAMDRIFRAPESP